MSQARRKTPLFDLGNVVIKVDFQPFFTWLSEKSGNADNAKAKAFLHSSLFYDFEFGNISRQEFTLRLSRLFQAELKQAEVEHHFCNIFPGLVEGMEPLLAELAKGGPLYALSNTNEVHLEWLMRSHPELMKNFTKVFASHEMHKRKPYPGIYQDVAEELGLPPEELLFFDDLHANVKGALQAGLDAHLFSDAGQVSALVKSFRDLDDTT